MTITFSTNGFHEGHRNMKTFSDFIANTIAEQIGIRLHQGMKPKQIANDLYLDIKTVYGLIYRTGIGIKKYNK